MINAPFLQRIARGLNTRLSSLAPSSFFLVLLLTFTAYLLGIFAAYQGPFDMIRFWVGGFWGSLSLVMQVVLMLLFGFSAVSSPAGCKLMRRLASLPRTPRGGVLFVTLFTAACSWLHWGLAMIIGPFLVREIARRFPKADYPLIVASAYIGMWAGSFGLSAPIPLAISREGHGLAKEAGVIPLTQTSFSLMASAGSCLGTMAVAFFLCWICPAGKEASPPPPDILERFEEEQAEENVHSAGVEISRKGPPHTGSRRGGMNRWPVWLVSMMVFSYIVYWFYTRGFDLDLNTFNFLLLLMAFLLYDTPSRFLKAMERSFRGVGGILIQFPLYCGIQGMLASSGVAAILWNWFPVSIPLLFPAFVYIFGAFLNLFLPISEGIWEVQGPLLLKTGQVLEVGVPRAINAFAAGEVMGNAIQPFWANPLLEVCGLSAQDIMGYCLMAFLVLSLAWIPCLLLFPS